MPQTDSESTDSGKSLLQASTSECSGDSLGGSTQTHEADVSLDASNTKLDFNAEGARDESLAEAMIVSSASVLETDV